MLFLGPECGVSRRVHKKINKILALRDDSPKSTPHSSQLFCGGDPTEATPDHGQRGGGKVQNAQGQTAGKEKHFRGLQGCNPQDSKGISIGHPLRAEGAATEMWVNVSLPPLLLSPSFTQKVLSTLGKSSSFSLRHPRWLRI